MASPIDFLTRAQIRVAKIMDSCELEQATINPFSGRAAVLSGDTTVTISGTNVKSDALIFATGHLPISSHEPLTLQVHSLVDAVSLTFGVQAATVGTYDFSWVAFANLT